MKVNKIERVVHNILCKYHLDGYVEVEYLNTPYVTLNHKTSQK